MRKFFGHLAPISPGHCHIIYRCRQPIEQSKVVMQQFVPKPDHFFRTRLLAFMQSVQHYSQASGQFVGGFTLIMRFFDLCVAES